PQSLSKSGLVQYLPGLVPTSRWDPQLLAASAGLTTSADLTAATALAAPRSPLSKLHTITTPTLMIQGRHDFLFDIDQALAAYKLLAGPKRLYISDLGHWPGSTTPPDATHLFTEAIGWFKHYLSNGPAVPGGIELAHDPYNGSTNYSGMPATHQASFSLTGSKTLTGSATSVRLKTLAGGPYETLGDSSVSVSYSGMSKWTHLVATVSVKGSSTPITAGAVNLSSASGTATIPLMNEAVLIPKGSTLQVTLGAESADDVYGLLPTWATSEPSGANITLGSATLKLSVMYTPVSG